MLSHHSRGANRAKLGRYATAFSTLAAGIVLSLGALGAFVPQIAAAQDPQTQISFTYLEDTPGIGGQVSTKQSRYLRPGVAFVSVEASFTGRGYGLGGDPASSRSGPGNRGFEEIGPGDRGEEALVENGDAFIVTPIIDPDLYVNYVLFNETGSILTSLTFMLEDTSDFYFFDDRTQATTLGAVSFSNSVGTTLFQNKEREGFRSLTFSAVDGNDFIDFDGFSAFNFAMHVPDGRPGQQFGAVLSPNGFTPLSIRGVPEPGTLLLLLPVSMLLGITTKAKIRRRAA